MYQVLVIIVAGEDAITILNDACDGDGDGADENQ